MFKDYDALDYGERDEALAKIAECAAERIASMPVGDYRRVAETADGDPAEWYSGEACRFCVIGALLRCGADLGYLPANASASENITDDVTHQLKDAGLLDEIEPWHSYDYLTGMLVADPSGAVAADKLRTMAATLRANLERTGA
jgi:hypothetical protein